jgi:hypothetical protein
MVTAKSGHLGWARHFVFAVQSVAGKSFIGNDEQFMSVRSNSDKSTAKSRSSAVNFLIEWLLGVSSKEPITGLSLRVGVSAQVGVERREVAFRFVEFIVEVKE